MTLATLDSSELSYSAAPTCGASAEARFIATESEENRRRLREAQSLGLGADRALEELFAVARECRSSNWDGYGAPPIGPEALTHACRFLSALPLGIPGPSVGAEPDGHVTLEWHRGPRRTLSLSISPQGDLHYAALLGPSKAYGTEPFLGETPSRILQLIRQVSLL
jgi:hypothetical protein